MTGRRWIVASLIAVIVGGCGQVAGSGSLAPSSEPVSLPSSAPSATPTLEPTLAAAPTVPEPPSSDPAAGLPYDCRNGQVFHVESLSGPADATEGTDPAAAVVPSLARRLGLQPTHWWLVFRSATEAQFLGQNASGTYDYVETKLGTNGIWGFEGLGDCQITYRVVGFSTLAWWLDPAHPVAAGDRELHVLAVDPCQPALLEGRVATPVIRYGLSSVLIAMTAEPGGSNGDICSNGAPVALTVPLEEAVGSRTLVDGGTWPARDARVVPTEP